MIGLDLGLAMSGAVWQPRQYFRHSRWAANLPHPPALPRIIREGEYRFGRSGDRDFSPPSTASQSEYLERAVWWWHGIG